MAAAAERAGFRDDLGGKRISRAAERSLNDARGGRKIGRRRLAGDEHVPGGVDGERQAQIVAGAADEELGSQQRERRVERDHECVRQPGGRRCGASFGAGDVDVARSIQTDARADTGRRQTGIVTWDTVQCACRCRA